MLVVRAVSKFLAVGTRLAVVAGMTILSPISLLELADLERVYNVRLDLPSAERRQLDALYVQPVQQVLAPVPAPEHTDDTLYTCPHCHVVMLDGQVGGPIDAIARVATTRPRGE